MGIMVGRVDSKNTPRMMSPYEIVLGAREERYSMLFRVEILKKGWTVNGGNPVMGREGDIIPITNFPNKAFAKEVSTSKKASLGDGRIMTFGSV
uniref:Uncharacterized protein n=1 Tax=Cannabis sativa TaxID=3483 RepID=A0A803P483_CANSA